VVKQADLVFALYVCGDHFDLERKRRDFEYYERITVRDSSLSAAIQAIVAAEVGHLHLAYEYFQESAFVDLQDLDGNTDDGLHLAAMAGTMQVAVAGFGGARHFGGVLAFAPRLPEQLTRICIRMVHRGRRLCIEISPEKTLYRLLAGESIELRHHGEALTVAVDSPQERPNPPAPQVGEVSPPPGRAPRGGS
jgi:alpha,alpha-trehalose phosphorylase